MAPEGVSEEEEPAEGKPNREETLGKVVLLIVLGVFVLLILYTISVYNRFQTLKNGAQATLNQVKVALKKRLDLISQLVESVKSYANFEKETLTKVTELRTSIFKSTSPKEIEKAEAESRAILGNVLATFENYPELKTSELAKDLNRSIQEVEDEIARLRYTYNNIVQEFNTALDLFPSGIVGKFFGFTKLEYLQFGKEVEKRPEVKW